MSRLCLYLSFAFIVTSVVAQDPQIKPPSLGVHFLLRDFNLLNNSQPFNTDKININPGLAFSYLKGCSNHVDFSISASGCFIDYPFKNKMLSKSKNLLLNLDMTTNLKLNTDQKLFTPYISTGVSVSKYKQYYGLSIPAGAGMQFNFKKEVYILIQSNYFFALTNNVTNHVSYSIGIAGNIKRKKRFREVTYVKSQPINLSLQDRDGDGIVDSEDRCPTIPGMSKYEGCPIPDTDNDGINDEEDKCPQIAGLVRYQGCAIPDTDGDGINDEEDNCITVQGPLSNKGCPLIDTAAIQKINISAQRIFFETGKATLLKSSYGSLDIIATILKDNFSYKINIEGHTDNTGDEAANQMLSENRANAVMVYLTSKGVLQEQMKAKGFGQSNPIADNNTAEGRSKNRRVEIKLSL